MVVKRSGFLFLFVSMCFPRYLVNRKTMKRSEENNCITLERKREIRDRSSLLFARNRTMVLRKHKSKARALQQTVNAPEKNKTSLNSLKTTTLHYFNSTVMKMKDMEP